MAEQPRKLKDYEKPISDESALRVVEILREMQYIHREFSRALRSLYAHSPGGSEACHTYLHNLIVDMRSGFYRASDSLARRSNVQDELGRPLCFNALAQMEGLITFPGEYTKRQAPRVEVSIDEAAARTAELWNRLQTHASAIQSLIGTGGFLHNSAGYEVRNTIAAAYAPEAPTHYPLDYYEYPAGLPEILPCDCFACNGGLTQVLAEDNACGDNPHTG